MAGFLIPALCMLSLASFAAGLDNGLALTPPMGWNSRLRYRCNTVCNDKFGECLNETVIMRAADYMVSEGYLAAGYEYVGIDDCWMARDRDPDSGRLRPDPLRFPSGIKGLADYVHSKGLKLALYQNYGNVTCSKVFPGIYGHEKLDMETFAEWGIDYLKLSACWTDPEILEAGYQKVGKYLNETGRPIVFACNWPSYNLKVDLNSVGQTCNTWRRYRIDITDSWDSLDDILFYFGEDIRSPSESSFTGPGRWNDPDVLLIGNDGLSEQQARVQMAVWAILGAPLVMSADLAKMRPIFRDILTNKDIIAVNQNSTNPAGSLYYSGSTYSKYFGPRLWTSVWLRRGRGMLYIAFVNHMPQVATFSFSIDSGSLVQDLYHEDPDKTYPKYQQINIVVPTTGVKFYNISAIPEDLENHEPEQELHVHVRSFIDNVELQHHYR